MTVQMVCMKVFEAANDWVKQPLVAFLGGGTRFSGRWFCLHMCFLYVFLLCVVFSTFGDLL